MSKRNSTGSSNTLFNYFIKSPTQKPLSPVNKVASVQSTPVSAKRKNEELDHKPGVDNIGNETDIEKKIIKKAKIDEDSNDEEDVPVIKKRKRIVVQSDSDEENSRNLPTDKLTVKDKLESSFKFERKTSSPSNSPQPKAKITKPEKLDESKVDALEKFSDSNNWIHCRLDWLKAEKIRDANKRRPDHPEYNPKTLFVPDDFLKSQTPGHKQWWEIKSKHYDCVLFFKVGKFYELYHMDASVGVNELGFSYMKGDFAHSGFPESAYARMSSSLVQKGYKIARVEQTETPEGMQQRTKSMSGKEKVVRREVCQVTCKGVEVCTLLDSGPTEAAASYMMAIAEQESGKGTSTYGVCFVDTSIGMFHLGEFEDDRYSSRLLTTLAHHPPALILHEKSRLSSRTLQILRMSCQTARKEALLSQKEFLSAEDALKLLNKKYKPEETSNKWFEDLKQFLYDGDIVGHTPAKNCSLAIRCLGACVWYLSDCLLDIQVMGMARLSPYTPPDVYAAPKVGTTESLPGNMVLDAYTLLNLHITGEEQSLVSKINYCTTPMGKRLLHQWVYSPSCNIQVINERQKAISYLLNEQSIVQDVRGVMNNLPDMERLFTKIHTLGNLKRSKNHPDSKAILYEIKTYSKKKVLDFLAILNGFQSITNIMQRFTDTDSELIKRLTQFAPNGQFPNYSENLKFFKEAFNHELAMKEGTILPEKGVDSEYDGAIKMIDEIKVELDEYLKTQEKYFNCKVTYFGSDKKRYQLEVPESKAGKAGSGYQLEGTRKGYKRYSTSETKEYLSEMLAAEENVAQVLKDLSRRIFEKFSQSHEMWSRAIQCISTIDVLISLAEYTRLQSCDMCIPIISPPDKNTKPFVYIKDGRHPCIGCSDGDSSYDYIPNDTELGVDGGASVMLLTGPNMGGKSTLMRQLGLLTVMAQIGCHIPASECSMSLVDRIFTRLGAHDDIMTAQSTFLVELSETAAMLKHATRNSLILLDELGRGTSTYDGTAIAGGVLDELCRRKPRTIFSTHYHTLVEDLKDNQDISLAHMACMVETDEDGDDVTQETVTFMYKLTPGACPKSYGFNAARLAGISRDIIRRAHVVSHDIEKEATLLTMFKKLMCKPNGEMYKNLLNVCKTIEV